MVGTEIVLNIVKKWQRSKKNKIMPTDVKPNVEHDFSEGEKMNKWFWCVYDVLLRNGFFSSPNEYCCSCTFCRVFVCIFYLFFFSIIIGFFMVLFVFTSVKLYYCYENKRVIDILAQNQCKLKLVDSAFSFIIFSPVITKGKLSFVRKLGYLYFEFWILRIKS